MPPSQAATATAEARAATPSAGVLDHVVACTTFASASFGSSRCPGDRAATLLRAHPLPQAGRRRCCPEVPTSGLNCSHRRRPRRHTTPSRRVSLYYARGMSISPPAARLSPALPWFSLPVVIDVETGGSTANSHAYSKSAAVIVTWTPRRAGAGRYRVDARRGVRGIEIVRAFSSKSGIDPDHPFRFALPERQALEHLQAGARGDAADRYQRAILVGHNAAFDLGFLNAAIRRTSHKRSVPSVQLLRHGGAGPDSPTARPY